jgi:hypothetical protein
MSRQISLKEAERRAFITRYNDGLWDIFLGCFFLMFVVAPYLSSTLGDFWSSAVFVPFLGLVLLVILLVRKHVVTPRVGVVVTFRPARTARLMKFNVVMLVVNVLAFILGIAAALSVGKVPGQLTSISFGLILLICFSIAAYFLEFKRLYAYGLLVGLSPLVGEWLWSSGYASHHGFPVTFGTATVVMILVGVVVFVRLLHNNPLPAEGIPSGEA